MLGDKATFFWFGTASSPSSSPFRSRCAVLRCMTKLSQGLQAMHCTRWNIQKRKRERDEKEWTKRVERVKRRKWMSMEKGEKRVQERRRKKSNSWPSGSDVHSTHFFVREVWSFSIVCDSLSSSLLHALLLLLFFVSPLSLFLNDARALSF